VTAVRPGLRGPGQPGRDPAELRRLLTAATPGWQCTSPAAAVDTTAACNLLYHVTDAVSRFALFSSPYYWQCWN
jgi:hypothetical protein